MMPGEARRPSLLVSNPCFRCKGPFVSEFPAFQVAVVDATAEHEEEGLIYLLAG